MRFLWLICRLTLAAYGAALLGLAGVLADARQATPLVQRIAYTELDFSNNSRRLVVMDVDGRNKRYLTEAGVAVNLAWSPDGRWVLYQDFNDNGLYRALSSGRRPENLGYIEEDALDFAWSPHTNRLILVTRRPVGIVDGNIFQDGEQIGTIPFGSGNDITALEWTPQGDNLLVGWKTPHPFDDQVYLISPDATVWQLLLHYEEGTALNPDLSPDRLWMAYQMTFSRRASNLYRIFLDDNLNLELRPPPERLTYSRFEDENPRYSPDGAWIAFTRFTDLQSVHLMRADGSDLAVMPIGNSLSHDWSPDGRWLAFQGYDAQTTFIYRVRIDPDYHAPPPFPQPDPYCGVTACLDPGAPSYTPTPIYPNPPERMTSADFISETPLWSPIVDMAWAQASYPYLGAALILLGVITGVPFGRIVRA